MDVLYKILSPSLNKFFVCLGVLIGLIIIPLLILKSGLVVGLFFAALPLIFYVIFRFVHKPIYALWFLFVVNYIIMGVSRYFNLPIPPGIIVDCFILLTFLVLYFHTLYGNISWRSTMHPLFYLSVIWLVYCILEVVNPQSTLELWATSVRSIAIYLFLLSILVSVICNRYKYVKQFLILWSVLILLAGVKAYIQKNYGFDVSEKIWLQTIGGHTHLISSGIRYFSFFTDAANFGCHMAFAMVIFSISAIYIRSTGLKIYFLVIAAVGAYGMMISGTRAAMVVPFVGFACFIFIVRQWKWIIAGCLALVLVFMFFNFTYIGENNSSIRRMRTAFRFEQDASFNVRLDNQQKMKEFMGNYPFGLGLGSAKHVSEGDLLYKLPTDSSLVHIWVETGMVGLILYVSILLAILILGMYYVMFKLKHPELRGITAALTAGFAGLLAAGYANEVLHQFPAGPTLYICMTFIVLSPFFEKELNHDKKS